MSACWRSCIVTDLRYVEVSILSLMRCQSAWKKTRRELAIVRGRNAAVWSSQEEVSRCQQRVRNPLSWSDSCSPSNWCARVIAPFVEHFPKGTSRPLKGRQASGDIFRIRGRRSDLHMIQVETISNVALPSSASRPRHADSSVNESIKWDNHQPIFRLMKILRNRVRLTCLSLKLAFFF